ncbi:hypothetical protein RAVI111496_03620 [Rahnella victoriana]
MHLKSYYKIPWVIIFILRAKNYLDNKRVQGVNWKFIK